MTPDLDLQRLLAAWLDGDATEQERGDLLRLLDSSPDLRREFAEQIAMIGALSAVADPEPRWLELFGDLGETEETPSNVEDFEAHAMARIEEAETRPGRGRALRFFALGAAVAALVLVSLHFRPQTSPAEPTAIVEEYPAISRVVAVITGSEGIAPADKTMENGTFLPPGLIEQESGWLGIQTLTGVSITLTAPFKVNLVSPERVYMERGQARVHVPEGAEGFVMESRSFEVLDLGTEFAAHVNPDGTGSCRVYEGKADVSFLDGLGQSSATRRVSAGESVKITPSQRQMSPSPGDAGIYSEMQIPPKPLLALSSSYPAEVLSLKPLGYWRFEEIRDGRIASELPGWADMLVHGDATIEDEADGNHSGKLRYDPNNGAFSIDGEKTSDLAGDFTIAMFVQLDWLQNYTLVASSRWRDDSSQPRGNQFVFKAYASFEQSGLQGTGLYAVFRDQPAWDGGTKVFGNRLMRPKFWHHVAISRSAGEVTLHLDGKPVARESIRSVPIDFDHLFIGRSDSPNRPPEFLERSLIGNVDELALFGRALQEREITILAEGKR